MRKTLSLIALASVCALCANTGVAEAKEPAPLPQSALESVVRIDMGGNHRGSAVVVSTQGYLVTSKGTITGYEYSRDLTVTDARYKATVIAIDDAHEIALIKTDHALPNAAVFENETGPKKNDRACLVGYVGTGSSPQMIERRELAATVSDTHFSGESSGTLDLHNLLIVAVGNHERSGVGQNGATVFLPENGRFAGIIIGTMAGSEPTRYIVIPASTIASFLASRKISVTTQ